MTLDFEKFYFSYSSLSTFETCKYGFKLAYIDRVPRVGNFFSDFGSAIHSVLEKYFSGELEIYELLGHYEKEYYNIVINSPPAFLRNVGDAYYNAGLEFFRNFDFDKSEYDIINVEEFVRGSDGDINLVIKPDLILTKKNTSDIIILDFKTSEIIDKRNKTDEEKLNGYKKQLGIYAYYLWAFKGIEIKKARLWFIRSNTFYDWTFDAEEIVDAINWVKDVATNIKNETSWDYNNSNKFMCSQLCGVRMSCIYRSK